MSPHQIIAVGVRIFAVWLVVYVVWDLPVMYINLTGADYSDERLVILATVVLILLLAIGLWRFPLTIARKLASSSAPEPATMRSPDLWLAMGCALMGLFLLSLALPPLVQDLMLYREGFFNGASELKVRLAYDLPRAVIGLWLILGARGFRKLFWWAQNAGRSQPSE